MYVEKRLQSGMLEKMQINGCSEDPPCEIAFTFTTRLSTYLLTPEKFDLLHYFYSIIFKLLNDIKVVYEHTTVLYWHIYFYMTTLYVSLGLWKHNLVC